MANGKNVVLIGVLTFLMGISVKEVFTGSAVEYCHICPAYDSENNTIRACEEEMPLEVEEAEMCPDKRCFIRVLGDHVQRGCYKDMEDKSGKKYETCDPMFLYLDKKNTEPMFCLCSQRKHCNDRAGWAEGPFGGSARKGQHNAKARENSNVVLTMVSMLLGAATASILKVSYAE